MAELETRMREAALRSVAARRVGNETDAAYWAAEVDNIQARITIRDREQAYRILVDNRHG